MGADLNKFKILFYKSHYEVVYLLTRGDRWDYYCDYSLLFDFSTQYSADEN